jgi:O-antigen/teichoic acid export membrane protein
MGANAVLMLLLAHHLDLNSYGLLVLTISGQLLLSRIIMLGVDVGLVRLSSTPELRSRFSELVMSGFVVMAGTTVSTLLILPAAIPLLSWLSLPLWLLPCIAAGAIGTSLVDFGYSLRLARQEYALAALAQGGTAIWRFALTAMTAIFAPVQIFAVFVAYHGASLLSGLAQALVAGRMVHRSPERKLTTQLLSYSFWQGKANLIVIFSLYQGTFLLMLLGQQSATGIFGLALTLSLGFFAVYNAYFEYLISRTRSIENLAALRRWVLQAGGAAIVLIFFSFVAALLIALLIPRLVKPEFVDVVPVFCYLAASMILLLLQAPLEAACHYLLRPQLVSFTWLLRAILIGASGLVLAPRMQATGAAIAQLIGSAVALSALAAIAARQFKGAAG